MNSDQDKQTSSHIHEDVDGDRQYVLHPQDNDLFVRTGRQVIEGCSLSISVEVWLDELNAMFGHIRNWIETQGDDSEIIACYAVPRGAGTGVFFVPHGNSFNFDLADRLAKLSIQLMRQFNTGSLEVHQLPDDELDHFIGETVVEIYRDARRPHTTMAS